MFGDDIRKNMRELYKERKIIKNCILSMIIIMKTAETEEFCEFSLLIRREREIGRYLNGDR